MVVYASSIAVYGEDLPIRMNESTATMPALSYGAHKRMIEILLEDLSRRKEIDGRALRLPGIVARPRTPNGLKSAFMSDLIHALAAGETFECPVAADATAWWMSAICCVANLLRAAELDTVGATTRIWQLPTLHLSMAQLVDALAKEHGDHCRTLVTFKKDSALQKLFGSFPPLRTPRAKAMGFQHDGSPGALVRNALGLNPSRSTRDKKASTLTLDRIVRELV